MKIQLQKADACGNLFWTEPQEVSNSMVVVMANYNTTIQWREVA